MTYIVKYEHDGQTAMQTFYCSLDTILSMGLDIREMYMLISNTAVPVKI